MVTAYSGKEPYIFISYAHKNNRTVMPIIERMSSDGYRVWYDDGIVPGSEWDDNIAKHINECSCLIAMISDEYMASDNCRDELNFARDLNKPRLLVYLKEVTLPIGMQMRLNRIQAVHKYAFSNDSDFYRKLYAAEIIFPCKASRAVKTNIPPKPNPKPNPKPDPKPTDKIQGSTESKPAKQSKPVFVFEDVTPPKPLELPKLEIPSKTEFQNEKLSTIERILANERINARQKPAYEPKTVVLTPEEAKESAKTVKYSIDINKVLSFPQNPSEIKATGLPLYTDWKGILIPASVTKIVTGNTSAFTRLESITVEEGNKVYHSNGNCLIETATKSLVAICKNSVIPNDGSVERIKSWTFCYCSGFDNIRIPSSVKIIEEGAFAFSSGIGKIEIDSANPCYSSNGNCIINKLTKTLEVGFNNTVIPSDGSVGAIAEKAFLGCSEIKSIVIPDCITNIGKNAFYNCNKLEKMTLPFTGAYSGATDDKRYFSYIFDIEKYLSNGYANDILPYPLREITVTKALSSCAFVQCRHIERITLKNGITSIDERAFCGCVMLKSLSIPASVQSIGDSAFASTALSKIDFQGTKKEWKRIKKAKVIADKWKKCEVVCTDGVITL